MTELQLYAAGGAAVVLLVLVNKRGRRNLRKTAKAIATVIRAVASALRAIGRAARWVWTRVRPAPRTPAGLPTLRIPRGAETRKVKRVVDGDTLWLVGDHASTRLLSINAPEKGQPGGAEATAWLRRWAPPGTVLVVADDPDAGPITDKYGRPLRYLWRDDTSLNLAAVYEGVAVADVYRRTDHYRQEFQDAQRAAQRDERGIWPDARPIQRAS